ncbi:MarR family winged helix-turn-helix transcriptional regulator [Lactococcus ileimucosae]|uniref:MarR family winged helix-turn-helix transcriptional regulator n=1 Tax=Lactococcus ileimucosae TaxID=2941329 RepID=UPI003517216E
MEFRMDKLTFILNHKLHTELNFQYKKIGLNSKNYIYLEKIDENPGVSQAFFIKEFHREQSIVTRQINELVSAGWIRKQPASDDHRRSELYLTPKAQQALPLVKKIYCQVIRQALEGLTADEAQVFASLLSRLVNTYHPLSDKHPPVR